MRLVGKKTNRAAIGARIKLVTAGEKSLTLRGHRTSVSLEPEFWAAFRAIAAAEAGGLKTPALKEKAVGYVERRRAGR